MVHNCDKYTCTAASELGLRNARAERDEASRDTLMEWVWRFLEQYPPAHPENELSHHLLPWIPLSEGQGQQRSATDLRRLAPSVAYLRLIDICFDPSLHGVTQCASL
jgi:hypothetical protein